VYPSSVWLAGDLLRLESVVPVSAQVDGPVVAELWVGVRAGGDTLLPGPQGDTVSVGRVAVSTGVGCTMAGNVRQDFGDEVRLVGYRVTADGVTLCWQALRPLSTDYTVFVHVLDEAGHPLATGDGPPRGGLYPTTAWAPGEQVEDPHALAVPAGARIQVGLYHLADGARLPLAGSAATALELGP
jgi:hypothetical protein